MLLKMLSWEIDQYGADVVATFGEYCGHQRRITVRIPKLQHSLDRVSNMIDLLMRG